MGSDDMAITKIATQNHEEWKELRSKFIGGSDAAAVVGLNPYASAYSLWAEKTGKTAPFEGNLATEVGTYLEEFVAKKFEQETGKKVRRCNQSILNDKYPWAIANIDRELVGEDAGLEIKTTSELLTKKFAGGEFPSQYYVQCTHYLAMTGKQRWYLAVLIGNRDFKIFTIERDETEIDALMKAEEEFWKCVTTKTPPVADGSNATTEALKNIYPEEKAGAIDLFGYEDCLTQYMALKNQIDELAKLKEEMANRVKAYMGDSALAEGNRYKVSWVSQNRNTFDVKRFQQDHGHIDLAPYYKTTSSRVFKVSER